MSIGDDVLKKLVPSADHEYQLDTQRDLLHDLQMKIAKHSVSMHELLTHVGASYLIPLLVARARAPHAHRTPHARARRTRACCPHARPLTPHPRMPRRRADAPTAPLDGTKWEAKGATKTTFTHYLRVVPTVFDGFLPITFTSKNHAPGAAIGVTRSYQFIAHSHQYALKAPGSGSNGGAGDTGCVSWRQVRPHHCAQRARVCDAVLPLVFFFFSFSFFFSFLFLFSHHPTPLAHSDGHSDGTPHRADAGV